VGGGLPNEGGGLLGSVSRAFFDKLASINYQLNKHYMYFYISFQMNLIS
jgi:hypothetical protein